MIALIISDDETVISAVDGALHKAGYDTVIYRWLLKALDNVEEIRPDLAVISVSDYPRHWKTFTQFVSSGIGGSTSIFLYVPEDFSESEQEKARALGVEGFFSVVDDECLEKFRAVFADKSGISVKKETEPPALIMTNHKTNAFVTGIVQSYKNDEVEFSSDIPEQSANLETGDSVAVTVKDNGTIAHGNAEVVKQGKSLLLKIKELYEKTDC